MSGVAIGRVLADITSGVRRGTNDFDGVLARADSFDGVAGDVMAGINRKVRQELGLPAGTSNSFSKFEVNNMTKFNVIQSYSQEIDVFLNKYASHINVNTGTELNKSVADRYFSLAMKPATDLPNPTSAKVRDAMLKSLGSNAKKYRAARKNNESFKIKLGNLEYDITVELFDELSVIGRNVADDIKTAEVEIDNLKNAIDDRIASNRIVQQEAVPVSPSARSTSTSQYDNSPENRFNRNSNDLGDDLMSLPRDEPVNIPRRGMNEREMALLERQIKAQEHANVLKADENDILRNQGSKKARPEPTTWYGKIWRPISDFGGWVNNAGSGVKTLVGGAFVAIASFTIFSGSSRNDGVVNKNEALWEENPVSNFYRYCKNTVMQWFSSDEEEEIDLDEEYEKYNNSGIIKIEQNCDSKIPKTINLPNKIIGNFDDISLEIDSEIKSVLPTNLVDLKETNKAAEIG